MEHLTRTDLRKNIMTILYQINVYKTNKISYDIQIFISTCLPSLIKAIKFNHILFQLSKINFYK